MAYILLDRTTRSLSLFMYLRRRRIGITVAGPAASMAVGMHSVFVVDGADQLRFLPWTHKKTWVKWEIDRASEP